MPDKAKAIAVYNAWAEEVEGGGPGRTAARFQGERGLGAAVCFSRCRQAGHEIPGRQDRGIPGTHRGHGEGADVILAGIAAAVGIVIGGAYWLLRYALAVTLFRKE